MPRHGMSAVEVAIRREYSKQRMNNLKMSDCILMDIAVRRGRMIWGYCPESLEQFIDEAGPEGAKEILEILDGLSGVVREMAGRVVKPMPEEISDESVDEPGE